ncbi:hypothetical protein SNEBB_008781 [Seison nebaliae]|nr:hypothetical protein SNEBB_008781 [Seison nebaliae]
MKSSLRDILRLLIPIVTVMLILYLLIIRYWIKNEFTTIKPIENVIHQTKDKNYHNAFIVQFVKVHKTGGTTLFVLFKRLQFLLNADKYGKFAKNLEGNIIPIVRRNIEAGKHSTFLFENYHFKPHSFETLTSFLPINLLRQLQQKYHIRFYDIRISIVRDPTNLLISRLGYTTSYGGHCMTGENLHGIFQKTKTFNINEKVKKTIENPTVNNTGAYAFARCLDQIRNVLCLDLIPNCLVDDLHYAPYERKGQMKKMVNILDEYFDFVLITEHFDASLLLLADMLNIDFFLFAYTPLNLRVGTQVFNESYRSEVKRFQKVDEILYEHFLGKMLFRLKEKYGLRSSAEYLENYRSKEKFTIRHSNKIIRNIAIFRLLKEVILEICVPKTKNGSYTLEEVRTMAGRYKTKNHPICLLQKLHTYQEFSDRHMEQLTDRPFISLKKFTLLVLEKIEELSSQNETTIVAKIAQSEILDEWGE